MRIWTLALALFPALSHADTLLTIPTAGKVSSGDWRLSAGSFSGSDAPFFRLDHGLGRLFEAGATWSGDRWSGDFSYHYLTPITDALPGISAGFRDVANTGPGRAAFLALTFRLGNDGDFNQNTPSELTVGGWTRDGGALFFGFRLPFTDQFRLLADFNSKQMNTGFEFAPSRQAAIRVRFQGGTPGVEARWTLGG
ncbi:MAG: hypothetical protein MH204_06840 [Fimbriimonadaceae bacterium]|nr:hypothetical protein [Fimbriimonadaceae bacterium]